MCVTTSYLYCFVLILYLECAHVHQVHGWSQGCLAGAWLESGLLGWSMAGVRVAWLESGLLGWSGGKMFVTGWLKAGLLAAVNVRMQSAAAKRACPRSN